MRHQVYWYATLRVRTEVEAADLDRAKRRANEVLSAATRSTVAEALDREALNRGLNQGDVFDVTIARAELLPDRP